MFSESSLNMEFIDTESDCGCGDCQKCGYASQVWTDEPLDESQVSSNESYESSFIDDRDEQLSVSETETDYSEERDDEVCVLN